MNLKGVADIRGCEVVPLQHETKRFCFMIDSHGDKSPMYLKAEDEKLYTCEKWEIRASLWRMYRIVQFMY